MIPDRVLQLINQRENTRLEFKSARNTLPNNLFETICAMLNRDGGDIVLGVDDNRIIKGIDENAVQKLLTNIASLSNNPEKIDPPFILFPRHHMIQDKHIIHIQVPASSELHRTGGVVYDRSADGDFKAQQPHQIASLYNHKRSYYTESTIYPALNLEHLNQELFPKVRQLMRSNNPNHPWLDLDNHKLLERAGLWRTDHASNMQGYTLAAALLFGQDQAIQSIVPHYKIDALVRIENTLRYDDRLCIQTNLIDAYDLLMEFVAKHLPDRFYMEDDNRVSLRSKIFREIVANLIVHREYCNAYPCMFVIHNEKVTCVNANNPHGEGPIDPMHFAAFTKNPTIAKFFQQLGRVDELGSGVLNVHRLVRAYGGNGQPVFMEGPTFTTEIPIPKLRNILEVEGAPPKIEGAPPKIEGAPPKIEGALECAVEGLGLTSGTKGKATTLVTLIAEHPGIRTPELQKMSGMSPRSLQRYVRLLRNAGIIEFRGHATRRGGYFLTASMSS